MGEVEVKVDDGYYVAYIRHVGPFNLVGSVFGEIFAWASEKGLSIGPLMGIYYDDPSEVPSEKLKSDVCIVVKGKVKVEPDERVKVKVIPSTTVAYAVYKGTWEGFDIPGTYMRIREWVAENDYEVTGHPREIYHEFQMTGGPGARVIVEVQFPVRKT